jgi:hypothetical protein
MMTELEDARSLEIGFDGGRLLLPVGGTTRLANHRSVSGNRVDHPGGIVYYVRIRTRQNALLPVS